MNIIGQKQLLNTIDRSIKKGFPRFVIIIGPTGSGKKTMCKYIADQLGIDMIIGENKVESVRETINRAHAEPISTLYVFQDIEEMSQNAMNALLKITEEPLETSYFILTTSDQSRILETLISRGIVLRMNPYSPMDIKGIVQHNDYNLPPSEMKLMESLCDNPGDLDLFISYGIQEFYDYCEQVLDNIGEVDGCNAFKVLKPIAIKKDSGWDIGLFLKTIAYIAYQRNIAEYNKQMSEVVTLCSKYSNKLKSTKGINRQMVMDNWVLNMREVL